MSEEIYKYLNMAKDLLFSSANRKLDGGIMLSDFSETIRTQRVNALKMADNLEDALKDPDALKSEDISSLIRNLHDTLENSYSLFTEDDYKVRDEILFCMPEIEDDLTK